MNIAFKRQDLYLIFGSGITRIFGLIVLSLFRHLTILIHAKVPWPLHNDDIL